MNSKKYTFLKFVGNDKNRMKYMRRIYGYVRIQFPGQNADSQIVTLLEMQVSKKDIYVDRQDGNDNNSLEYQKLLQRLKADDLLYIKSLDVLGSDYREIGQQWRILTKEKKADIVVLDMPQLDTRRGKTQFDTLVSDIVLTMLEYVPNAVWLARKQRQREGIAKARMRGVQFGRPELPVPENFTQVYQSWRNKEINGENAARMCHMSKANFYKKARERKQLENEEIEY